MRTIVSFLVVLAVAAACGKKEQQDGPAKPAAEAPAKAPGQAEPAQEQADAQAEAQQRASKVAELQAKGDELRQSVAAREQELGQTIAQVEREQKELDDISKLRRRFSALLQDRNREASKLATMEKQFEELKNLAESAVTGELKTLQNEEREIEKRYDEVYSSWMKELEDANFGAIEESPAAREIRVLRELKQQWFQATPLARSGRAHERERNNINEGFRGWLRDRPERMALAAKILQQDQAPSGKTPDSYDFTELEFFVLIQLLEDALDRQNIAVERKQLSENEDKLKAIEKELDAVREKIAGKMAEGGGDLEQYEDLASRLPDQRKKVQSLEQAVQEYGKIFRETDEKMQELTRMEDEARQKVEVAKKELAEVQSQLRNLGVR